MRHTGLSLLLPKHGILWIVLTALLALSGMGCEDDDGSSGGVVTSEGKDSEKESLRGKSVAATEAGEDDEEERLAYSYNPIGKRDPFRSFISKDIIAPEIAVETPLQRYEIDQYQLVAVIWGLDEPVAMVEDPEGMGHFLRRDTLIGRNWGKVVRISSDEVIVAEEYRDFEGKLIVNEIPLRLPVENEESR